MGPISRHNVSAYYTGLCIRHGKQVVYTTIGFPKQDDLIHGLHLSIERYRAASFSRELSAKVWTGSAKLASMGYWLGGIAPYGMQRHILDENGNLAGILKNGQSKAIHNQRVILKPSNDRKTTIVRRIFDWFVNRGMTVGSIADELNLKGVKSPLNKTWTRSTVSQILSNRVYTGEMVWNRHSGKMQSKRRDNEPDEWIKASHAFDGVISEDMFERAQQVFKRRRNERSDGEMLAKLRQFYHQYNIINDPLIQCPTRHADAQLYRSRFKSVETAFQRLFQEIIE